MPDKLFFTIAGQGKDTLFDGAGKLEVLIPLPLEVNAGEVAAYFVPANKNAPLNITSNLHWQMPDGAEVKDFIGEGLQLLDEQLMPQSNGYLTIRNGRMVVTEKYEIFGRLSKLRGSKIETKASIIIHDEAAGGIEICSGGDVVATELLEDVIIRATGNIEANGGIVGNGDGKLVAGGDIYCLFSQQANIEAMGNITIGGSLINSNTLCGKKLTVEKRGLIVGGKIMARDGIEAKQVGSEAAVETDIEVGRNPFQVTYKEKISKELSQLEQDMKSIMVTVKHNEHELGKIVKFIPGDMHTSLFEAALTIQKNSEQHNEAELYLINNFGAGIMRLMRMSGEKQNLKKELEKSEDDSGFIKGTKVKITETAHPGVVIKIEGETMRLTKEYDRVAFFYNPKESEITAGNL